MSTQQTANDALLLSGGMPGPLSAEEQRIYGSGAQQVLGALRQCPQHAPTPLHSLPEAAAELGLAALLLKDESGRFGLDSFKALGGAYAVLSAAAERAGLALASLDSLDALRQSSRGMVFCAATDGNHGRSVAAGARLLGARCVIFVHEQVAPTRVALLRAGGAEVRVVAGHYDDSVAACRETARGEGWTLVADVAASGEDADIPTRVMQGYLALAHEIRAQLREPPTHVFLQAGVGGLAAAMVAAMADFGWRDTRVVIAEPAVAACLRLAAERGEPAMVPGDIDSVMGMLSCGIASAPAWSVLRDRVFAYLSLPETAAPDAARWLLAHSPGNHRLRIGPSGVAGLAALLAAINDEALCAALGLNADSRVLLLATEGDVDGLLGDVEKATETALS